MTYRIRDWNTIFENNRTRELKRLEWVPVPNKMDGSGYRELVDHENGAAHLGAWYAILEISSRQKVRGTIPQESAAERGDIPQDLATTCRCLARISGLPPNVFLGVIPRLLQIGWLEEVEPLKNLSNRTIPQDDAGKCLSRARNGIEGNGMEQKGTAAAESNENAKLLPVELRPKTEYPETLRVLQEHDRSADVRFVQRLVDESARGIIGDAVASTWTLEKQRKALSDPVIARCCREVYATPRKKPPGTGLLLTTVPRILIGGKLNYV